MSSKFSYRGALLTVLTATVATSSCGGGGGGGSSPAAADPPRHPVVAPLPVNQSELDIAQSVYDGSSRTPEGFYSEPSPSGHTFVSTTHLKNANLDTTLSEAQPLFELCTDDWNEALEWSELSAQNAATYANLTETNDAAHYFEFGRVRAEDPSLYVRERVFKCAYVNRDAANLRAGEGAAGLLNARPLTSDALRTFSEYLWSFTPYNNFGNVVLNSSGTSSAAALTHTLEIATLERNALSSTCDRIDVLAWRHRVDTATGELTLDVETLFSFGATEAAGVVELCEG